MKRAEEKLKLTKKVIETGDFASTSAKPTYAQNRTQVKCIYLYLISLLNVSFVILLMDLNQYFTKTKEIL